MLLATEAEKREVMNFDNQEQAQNNANVVSLFGRTNDEGIMIDPLAELLDEAQLEDFMLEEIEEHAPVMEARKVVTEDQFPDQSLFVLEEQLQKLKTNLGRIRFYLGDMDDLLVK